MRPGSWGPWVTGLGDLGPSHPMVVGMLRSCADTVGACICMTWVGTRWVHA